MTQSKQAFFGRSWELTVVTSDKTYTVSSSAWDPEALRIKFEVSLAVGVSSWSAKIEIYNPTNELMQAVLTQGQRVTLKAGYQTQPYGTIFEGVIYQPKWTRENVTDYKLTLLCYTALKEVIGNYVSTSGQAGQSQAAIIAQLCAAAHTPVAIGNIDTNALPDTKLPRARAFFGDPMKFVKDVAQRNILTAWVGFDGLNLADYQLKPNSPTLTYGPSSGLIGTPKQTEGGVDFTVLLDPRLVINGTPNRVKLEGSINQLSRATPSLEVVTSRS